jgi:hypothetical protein
MEETAEKIEVPPDLEAFKVALIESWERIRERIRNGNELELQISGLLTEAGESVGMIYEEEPPPDLFGSDVEEVRELEDITDDLSTDLEKFQQVRAL